MFLVPEVVNFFTVMVFCCVGVELQKSINLAIQNNGDADNKMVTSSKKTALTKIWTIIATFALVSLYQIVLQVCYMTLADKNYCEFNISD